VSIDEVGYIPFEPEAANLFFQLMSNRYERASLIVTSNRPFGSLGRLQRWATALRPLRAADRRDSTEPAAGLLRDGAPRSHPPKRANGGWPPSRTPRSVRSLDLVLSISRFRAAAQQDSDAITPRPARRCDLCTGA
jgi:hypothetical protein